MKTLSESIIGRKSTSALDRILRLPGDKFNKDRAYKIMEKLFHHEGAIMIADLSSPYGFKKVYKNPSPLIRKLGNWCAPKCTNIYDCFLDPGYFGIAADRDIPFICVEYVFQGGDEQFDYDYDSLASAIFDGLSAMPEFKTTPIILLPHVRDGIWPAQLIYLADPAHPKAPICLNSIIGNDKTDKLIDEITLF